MSDNEVKNTAMDPREFRHALGQFATGVTIVTAEEGDGGYVGTTASSFNSVSMDPPLILWSIDKKARSLPAYQQAQHFCVNVLAADQVSLSNHFARPQDDKFDGLEFQTGIGGAPMFKGCAARFQCETAHIYEGGDHLIIVGKVLDFDVTGRDALLFHRGKYVVSEYHPFSGASTTAAETDDTCFTDDYLHYLVGRSFSQLMAKLNLMLPRERFSDTEFRVLTLLSGREGCTIAELCTMTLLGKLQVLYGLQQLQRKGLIGDNDLSLEYSRVILTEKGQIRLDSLLTAARSNEADVLGTFNVAEAKTFKQYLRRIINWTAEDQHS